MAEGALATLFIPFAIAFKSAIVAFFLRWGVRWAADERVSFGSAWLTGLFGLVLWLPFSFCFLLPCGFAAQAVSDQPRPLETDSGLRLVATLPLFAASWMGLACATRWSLKVGEPRRQLAWESCVLSSLIAMLLSIAAALPFLLIILRYNASER